MSHGTIYLFKNYFVTVFSIFNFKNYKFNPNRPLVLQPLQNNLIKNSGGPGASAWKAGCSLEHLWLIKEIQYHTCQKKNFNLFCLT